MIKNNIIHPTSIVYGNVEIGNNVRIGPYCVIGESSNPNNRKKTIIGDNSIIRSHTIIYEGNKIGMNFSSGHHVFIRESNTIGTNVSIGTQSCIEHHVEISDNVRIHSQVFIPEYSVLEEGCWLGPKVTLTNAKYPQSKNVKNELSGPILKTKCKVGASVVILPGKVIGAGSLVGSGSIVNKDVNENSVYVGNPIRKINNIDSIDGYVEEDESL